MLPRLLFFLIALFWLTMNFLLWRSEFGGQKPIGSSVSLETVWNKVLTAPDASSLEIYHHGKKIGFCRWVTSVGALANKKPSDEFEPEGMVDEPNSYNLDLEGNATLNGSTNRLRFDVNLKLSLDRAWEEFTIRANMRPDSWELHATAADQKARFLIDGPVERWEQTFTFADLRNPQVLLREFGGPLALGILGTMGNFGLGAPDTTNSAPSALPIKWDANNDTMRFGHSKVRVYRLRAKLFDRYEAFIFVSRVGEILWVELPDKLILSNDAFTHF